MNFKEAWKDLKRFEEGEDRLEQVGGGIDPQKEKESQKKEAERYGVGIILLMKKQSEKDETAKELFIDIMKAASNYIGTVDKHSESIIKKEGPDEIERVGVVRTRSHDALIDALNIYSRYCRKNGLDNKWRKMVGLDREEITHWVLNVASLVREELLNVDLDTERK